ncbi:hypothetical protein Dtox_3959 [Desulfofarcimen acetoxidans DSM 771]|uniref:Uncharacterized protein n=1 Tax=Desulfofarcimen acetoxidans (strain ATCC 49208 / DSM 771 / KCTC 5769 / VKM B-1644 / 5575) TaxID=485916 RepID=C8VY23_DESAS|nr:DUF2508 family protein [Desulfofarcimen acetoxidans]ACV64652.1 hypothetical protein Dtox_3959 [Desulfofarcimen acetoxidans DSM 771]
MKMFWYTYIYPKQQITNPLLKEAEEARREWQLALQQINQATCHNMLDHIIYKISSAERKFVALLKQAREEGLTSWPGELQEIYTQPEALPETGIQE